MSENRTIGRFPDPSTSKKDKDYHKRWVQAICRESLDSNYESSVAFMDTLVDFYNGTQGGDQFKFLQEAEDGDLLPAMWANYNKIKVKIDLLIGELAAKGYEIRVKHISSGSSSRKLDAKRKALAQYRMSQDLSQIDPDAAAMIAPQVEGRAPDGEDEIEDYYEYDYRELTEVIMEAAVKYCAQKSKLDYLRMSLFRDLMIFGRMVYKTEIVNGLPTIRRIDPRNHIFDATAEDDFLMSSSYHGEVRYMPVAEAAQQYGLSTEQIMKAYQDADNPQQYHAAQSSAKVVDGTSIAYFKREDGELKVLVLSAVWMETKKFNYKESVDKYGNEHLKFYGEKESSDNFEKVIPSHVKIWRKGTIIAQDICVDYGEVENQVRNVEDPFDTPCPYKACYPNYLNGKTVSSVEQLRALQNLKDITMFNVQLQMARAGGKGFVYDLAQTPDEWEAETVIKYLKTAGIAFIDSKKDGTPAQFNQFQSIDMTLSSSIEQYIAINSLIDREMDAITGINEARQGNVQYASQTVGVTQSALFQSNLMTKFKFDVFDQSISEGLNHIAGLVKIAWEDNEVFAPIIGDIGFDFINESVDLELDDYGVFFEAVPQAINDINSFQQIVMAALQSGQVTFIDAVKLLKEKEITPAIRKLEKALMRQEKKMMEQQMAQQKAQQEGQLAMAQQQNEALMAREEMIAQRDAAKMAGQKDIAITKGKLDLLKQ
jgi:hypothetical protein